MPNEQKTIEELLIELDAADTQLSNEAALVIRELKAENEYLQFEMRILQKNERLELSKIETLDGLK